MDIEKRFTNALASLDDTLREGYEEHFSTELGGKTLSQVLQDFKAVDKEFDQYSKKFVFAEKTFWPGLLLWMAALVVAINSAIPVNVISSGVAILLMLMLCVEVVLFEKSHRIVYRRDEVTEKMMCFILAVNELNPLHRSTVNVEMVTLYAACCGEEWSRWRKKVLSGLASSSELELAFAVRAMETAEIMFLKYCTNACLFGIPLDDWARGEMPTE